MSAPPPASDPFRPTPSPLSDWFGRLFGSSAPGEDPRVAGERRLEREFFLAVLGLVVYAIVSIVRMVDGEPEIAPAIFFDVHVRGPDLPERCFRAFLWIGLTALAAVGLVRIRSRCLDADSVRAAGYAAAAFSLAGAVAAAFAAPVPRTGVAALVFAVLLADLSVVRSPTGATALPRAGKLVAWTGILVLLARLAGLL